jgi:hypothetical protein
MTADSIEIGVTQLGPPEWTARAVPLRYERCENHAYNLVSLFTLGWSNVVRRFLRAKIAKQFVSNHLF